ncbi:MAG: alanyl-tRNA editing protein [Treponemataceae bacterium]
MATERRYYEDIFLDRGTASILSVFNEGDRRALILDSTLFYPEGGGQPGDRGTINGVAVTEVIEQEDGTVLHYVEGPGADTIGLGKAELRVDAVRRRYFATQHTAQHLLSATILRLFGKPTLSMRLGDDYCTIDVDAAELSAADLAAAEDAVFTVIEEDYPVITHLCPPENLADFPLRKRPPTDESVIRVIEIDGYDYSPCCGTHLPSTGRIGTLKIIGGEKYKGMTRVSFVAGRRAFLDHQTVRAAAESVSVLLKTPAEGIAAGVRALADKYVAQERTLVNLRETVAAFEAARLIVNPGSTLYLHTYGDRSMDDALRIGRAAQKLTDAVIVVSSSADRKAAVLTSRKDADLRPIMKSIIEAVGGKGGGGPSFQQLAFDSKAQLDAFMEKSAEAFKGKA